MQENFIHALGADVTTFVNTKLKDARGDVTPAFHGLFPDRTLGQVQVAAAAVGCKAENMRVMDEADAELPLCKQWQAWSEQQKQQETQESDHVFSLAGQIVARKGCLDLIAQGEKKSGGKFDLIAMMRVDMTVFAPFKPYCMYNLNVLRRKWDWFLMGPRDAIARGVSNLHSAFYGCQEFYDFSQERVEDYVYRHFPGIQEDKDLPIMLTRLNQPDMPSNVCIMGYFKNSGSMLLDPTEEDLCLRMTFQNQFNSLA